MTSGILSRPASQAGQIEDDIYRELAPLVRLQPEAREIADTHAPRPNASERRRRTRAPFHIVTQGECLLDVGAHIGVHLARGDIALLPHGSPHALRGISPGSEAPVFLQRHLHDEQLISGGTAGQAEARVISGCSCFEHSQHNLVLAALPEVVVLTAEDSREGLRVRAITASICGELQDDQLGSAAIAASLASSLMLLVLRAHLRSAVGGSGVFALLAKPQTGRALSAMLKDPAHSWTLEELADCASTSRSTLVRLFQKAVGSAPLAYLSELRLSLARHRIRSTNVRLIVVAEDVGYQSESSFSRAYSRRFGVAPGSDRGSP